MNYLRRKAVEYLTRGQVFIPQSGGLHNIGNSTPTWLKMVNDEHYLQAYSFNPVVNAVINIKADAKANMRLKIVDLEDNEIPRDKMTPDQARMQSILDKPNVLQSRYEFWKQFEVFKNTFGNAFIYASWPLTYNKLEDLTSMTNVWSQCMKPRLTGKFFDADRIDDIVSKWIFSHGTVTKEFEPAEILHRNHVSIDLSADGPVLGTSKLKALEKPISNIQIAFESRNVLGKKRGALGIISSASKDATGSVPLSDPEKAQLQDEFSKYGTQENQWQYIITKQALTFQRTTLPIKDLQLFEEVATDTMHVAHAYGVPEILVKAYLQGSTFENHEASERALYYNTTIPEANDDIIALNSYFKCEDAGFKVVESFDHVAVLQEDLKNRADVNMKNSAAFEKLFMKGGCTYDEWRKMMGQKPLDNKTGGKTLFELTPEERAILGINTQSNGTS